MGLSLDDVILYHLWLRKLAVALEGAAHDTVPVPFSGSTLFQVSVKAMQNYLVICMVQCDCEASAMGKRTQVRLDGK